MAEARRTVRLRIEGRVQGVGFRAFVEREAAAHRLDGWVRNRRDGGVEVVITGPPSRVEAMIDRCHAGPRGSRVDMLKVLDAPEAEPVAPGFSVWPTV
jgi:acylphosphatase